MANREKVIKGLEHHTNLGIGCTGCPYNGDCHQLPKDALELLKEQEAVVRCKDCKNNNQCSIQFKFANADNPGDWFCAYGKRRDDDA